MRILAVSLVVALSACNGGGGDSGAPAAPATDPNLSVQVKTPMSNFDSQGGSSAFSIVGSVSGSGTWTQSPMDSATLNGVQVLRSVRRVAGTMLVNGSTKPLASTSTRYFNQADNTLIGTDDGRYLKYTSYSLPVSVKSGDAGVVGTAEIWESTDTSNIHKRSGRVEISYSVAPLDASALRFTVSTDEFGIQSCTSSCLTYYDATSVFSYRKAHSDTNYRIDTRGVVSVLSTQAVTYTGLEKSGGAVVQDIGFNFQ